MVGAQVLCPLRAGVRVGSQAPGKSHDCLQGSSTVLHPSWPAGTGQRDPSFTSKPQPQPSSEASETYGSQVGNLAESSEHWANIHRCQEQIQDFSLHLTVFTANKQKQTPPPTPAQTQCRHSEDQGLAEGQRKTSWLEGSLPRSTGAAWLLGISGITGS